jgi:hypothetical protein
VFEEPEAALVCFQRRVRQIGVGERGRGRHDARDHRLAPAVEEILLHGVAERHVAGQSAKMRLKICKAVHQPRYVDRTGAGGAEECGRGGGNAGNGLNVRGNFLYIHPGRQIFRHGRPPAALTVRAA